MHAWGKLRPKSGGGRPRGVLPNSPLTARSEVRPQIVWRGFLRGGTADAVERSSWQDRDGACDQPVDAEAEDAAEGSRLR